MGRWAENLKANTRRTLCALSAMLRARPEALGLLALYIIEKYAIWMAKLNLTGPTTGPANKHAHPTHTAHTQHTPEQATFADCSCEYMACSQIFGSRSPAHLARNQSQNHGPNQDSAPGRDQLNIERETFAISCSVCN